MSDIAAIRRILSAFALAWAGAGCVAVPVSSPNAFRFERLVDSVRSESAELAVEPASAHPVVSVDGAAGSIYVGLAGKGVRRGTVEERHEAFSVETRRWLAFGFFPSFAEDLYRPGRSIRPKRFDQNSKSCIVVFGWPFATLYSILATPFSDDYAHSCHGWEDEGGYNGHVKRLETWLSREDRLRIGMPPRDSGNLSSGDLAHLSVFGFFKYTTFVVHPPAASKTVERVEESPFDVEVHGPYVVELSIPERGYRMRFDVPEGDVRAEFPLAGLGGGKAAATIRFFDFAGAFESDEAPADQRGVFDQARWKAFKTRIDLPPPSAAVAPRRTVVVEGRPKAWSVPFRLVSKKKLAKGGRWRYVIEIADGTKTAFDIDRIVRPDIVEELRNAFSQEHPEVPPGRIRAWARYELSDGKLVYTGSAFSIRPEGIESYAYDADTRRGTIRIRLGKGVDGNTARGWARDGISRILRDKNIALEAGGDLPDGATFRTTGETFENGVLAVDFEAEN